MRAVGSWLACLIPIGILGPHAALALDPFEVSAERERVSLAPYVEVLEEPAAGLDLADVRSPEPSRSRQCVAFPVREDLRRRTVGGVRGR